MLNRHLFKSIAAASCAAGWCLFAATARAQELPAPAQPEATAEAESEVEAKAETAAPQEKAVGEKQGAAPGITARPNPHGLPGPAGSGLIFEAPTTPRPGRNGGAQAEARRVTIDGIEISGLSDETALKALKSALGKYLNDTIVLFDGVDEHIVKRSDLGAKIPYEALLKQARAIEKSDRGGNVPVRYEVNLKVAQAAMERMAARLNNKGGTARLDVRDGEAVLLGGARVEMATTGSAWRVKQALESVPPRPRAELVVKRQESDSKLAQFRYLLADFSTPFDASNVGRTRNLKMAADNVTGTIVAADTVFSTNQAIGPRSAAAGWKEAKMFVSGQIVDGVGAGICQCATTLYNAALLAGLPVVERHQHSFRVNYAPASRDATIYWGHKDLRFRNDTGGPIYVQTFVRDERFHVRLFGTKKLDREVNIESRIISREKGTRSEAFRVIRTGTGEKREKLSQDYYAPAPAH